MALLSRSTPSPRPVRVLQFGEGNFLRAFIDWMIQRLNQKTDFNGQVRIIQPLPHGMADQINAQGGLYTLILRGIDNGKPVENREIIDVVNDCINPYTHWSEAVQLACSPDLRFVFSNTTEAGIEFKPESYTPEKCQNTFPAKLTSLLYARFQAVKGDRQRGLIIIPCELIDHNGSTLKECIRQYAALWQLPAAFTAWLDQACLFVNTLVDRIVAGYPRAEAARLEAELGYQDKLIDCGEIFHLFVIEGPASLEDELPFAKAGLNVIFTDNQAPYRTRKVRFLNGAHTASVLAAILDGLTFVDEMMADRIFGAFVARAINHDIFPTVNLPDDEKRSFADSVLERFRNPYAQHRLLSISLNSVSKWKVRVLPSLLDYVKLKNDLPLTLTFSLAALLRFYQIERMDGNTAVGRSVFGKYPINDSPEVLDIFDALTGKLAEDADFHSYAAAVLGETSFWGDDLNRIPGLTNTVAYYLAHIHVKGTRAVAKSILQEIR
ncbi:MAG: tagaturonate reductase [Lentisphaerae bacterium]|jgi:tagaturonate reductase|nr:tagaturonate reductase [Lentisphaerota bacterium]